MGAGASTAPDAAKGISFEQLEAAVAQQPAEVQARWSSDTLKTAFQQHDADGDGLLSKAEYDAALAATGSSGDVKDFGRDLPGAAEAAGMRQDQEEAIDTAMMMSAPKRKWDGRHMDEAIESVALSLAHEVKGAFLGCEVQKATNLESQFIETWQCLGRGDVDGALVLADTLCAARGQDSRVKTNEKYSFTHGPSAMHARPAGPKSPPRTGHTV